MSTMTQQEEYRCRMHENTIKDSTERINVIEHTMNTMQVSQARIEGDLSYIKKKLENGITTKLEHLTSDMSKILPIIEERTDLNKTIRNAIIIICVSGGASLLLFVMRLYFVK